MSKSWRIEKKKVFFLSRREVHKKSRPVTHVENGEVGRRSGVDGRVVVVREGSHRPGVDVVHQTCIMKLFHLITFTTKSEWVSVCINRD